VTEPRFKPGDQVQVLKGRAHVWRIARLYATPADQEPSYVLEDGARRRTAFESSLKPAPTEAADG
jgi:hypothetical protein